MGDSWNKKERMLYLFKEDVGNMEQEITIGTMFGTDYPIIALGNCNNLLADTLVLTILPYGLGFFPFNMDHILPLNIVRYSNCKNIIYDINKKMECKDKVYNGYLTTQEIEFKPMYEGFKQHKTCWIYFVILILFIYYINGSRK